MLRIHHARHFWQRALGLLGRRALAADEALLIQPCSSIHTFIRCAFMPCDADCASHAAGVAANGRSHSTMST